MVIKNFINADVSSIYIIDIYINIYIYTYVQQEIFKR